MEITVIGSVKQMEVINNVAEYFRQFHIKVNTPSDQNDRSLLTKQEHCIMDIGASDLVIAIPKSITEKTGKDIPRTILELEFGESTSYEIAIARKLGIPVIIWEKGD